MKLNRLVALVLSLALAAPAAAQQAGSAERDATHLLQRTTFGVRPQDVQAVLKEGHSAWLEKQLQPRKIDDDALDARLDLFPTVNADMAEMVQDYQRQQADQRRLAQQRTMDGMGDEQRQAMMDSLRRSERQSMTPEERRERQMLSPQYLLTELVGAKLTRAVYSERQLEEVMTDFWYNHFNVFFGKGLDRFMVADYEENAIRPHVFGKFRDMLEATAKHPAMLFYLDNVSSVAPDSSRDGANSQRQQLERFRMLSPRQQEEFLRRRGITREQLERFRNQPPPALANRQRGLNENYARELMELHTLGVDGGYTQKDVIEVARAFTGWQFNRGPGRGPMPAQRPGQRVGGRGMQPVLGGKDMEFVFRPQLHDRGEKIVLGKKLSANRGIEDGEEVLDILARHPSTAKFIAGKLVERFVSDAPDPAFVNEIAAVFTKTDGDLREVTRALFSSPRFYNANVQRAKVKTPFELVASALRVTDADVGLSRMAVQTLRQLGHLPYNEPAPTGFPASSQDWVNSGAMLNRMNFGLALAGNRIDGVRIDPRTFAGDTPPSAIEAWVPGMLQHLLPGVPTDKLQNTILTELAKPIEVSSQDDGMQGRRNTRNANAPLREKAGRALGLVLGSPEFQKK